MTLDEAKKVAEVLCEVDGGCPSCVHSATEDMQDRFPEFKWSRLVAEAKTRTRVFTGAPDLATAD
jgi:hypothetical protein